MIHAVTLGVACCGLPVSATAATISLGTAGNASHWLITGAGATSAPAFQTNVNRAGAITLTSNALSTGTFISGGSLAQFNGFWYAEREFTLPPGAFGITLSFNSLYGNDRVVLQLNGTTIGNADHLAATGFGRMAFPPGPPDQAFQFTNATSGSVSSGFVAGTNTLRLIVNNTGVMPITAPTASFMSATGDATTAYADIWLSYSVPEPATSVLTAVGLLGLLGRKRGGRNS